MEQTESSFNTAARGGKWLEGLWQAGALLLLAASIGLVTNAMRPDRLPLFMDGPPPASSLPGTDVVQLDEAEALYLSGAAIFVDARPATLYRAGHIKGSLSIPQDELEYLFSKVSPLMPSSRTIITYCDGDSCSLSHHLALALKAKGYTDVRVLVNGWSLWRQANLPVESSE